MPTTKKPRSGSMQYWPRKRAKRQYPKIRAWPKLKEPIPLGFAAYKAGMSHVIIEKQTGKGKSAAKDKYHFVPVTILECPPMKIASIRLYKKTTYGLKLKKEILANLKDKNLSRKIIMPKAKESEKEHDISSITPDDFDELRFNVFTQPSLTGIGKKKPEIFEVKVGGSKQEQLEYAKQNIGREISINDVFKEWQFIDIHAVTKGRGFQGPVKRFGISIRSHKSEKTKRGPGSLGGWKGQGHFMYRIAHAGQTGYHTRTEYNKQILKIGLTEEDIKSINPKGGFISYGIIKNPYIIVKGSVPGPVKRIIRLKHAIRKDPKKKEQPLPITYIHKIS